jgi:hypothetical protein
MGRGKVFAVVVVPESTVQMASEEEIEMIGKRSTVKFLLQ